METGFRRLTYERLDNVIITVNLSTSNRILRFEGLTSRWNNLTYKKNENDLYSRKAT